MSRQCLAQEGLGGLSTSLLFQLAGECQRQQGGGLQSVILFQRREILRPAILCSANITEECEQLGGADTPASHDHPEVRQRGLRISR